MPTLPGTPAPNSKPTLPKGIGDFTKPAPRLAPQGGQKLSPSRPTLPKGIGDFTKSAPNPFKPQQGVRPMAPVDRGNNPNRVANVIGKVGDYLGNIARSARDVPTALGTALDSRGSMARGERFAQTNPNATSSQVKSMSTAPIKNLVNQVGQVAGAVAGKKDTNRSDQYFGENKLYLGVNGNPGPLKNGK
jgi:hypothetical protein